MKLVSLKKSVHDEKTKSRMIRRRKNVPKNDIGIQVTPSQVNAAMEQLTQRPNVMKENAIKRIELKLSKYKNLFVAGCRDEEVIESPSCVSMFDYGVFEKII